MQESIHLQGTIPEHDAGKRLDQSLAGLFPDYSRSRIKEWIQSGDVRLDGACADKPRAKVLGNEQVDIDAKIELQEQHKAEAIELDIVYEDEYLLVLNKPVGLVVHPGAGNHSGTLLNALLHHCPGIDAVPRAGIVHRLDKDTSGLMVVAKTIPAQTHLVAQLQAREISREYEALVNGIIVAGGTVDEPIGRHDSKRTSMAVKTMGKSAVTHYRVMEKFRAHTHLRLKLETGRTHQIRVHMSHLHHPIVGDPLYGGRPKPPKHASDAFREGLRACRRQMLHAAQLELAHPITEQWMSWQAPLPEDMVKVLALMQQDKAEHPEEW